MQRSQSAPTRPGRLQRRDTAVREDIRKVSAGVSDIVSIVDRIDWFTYYLRRLLQIAVATAVSWGATILVLALAIKFGIAGIVGLETSSLNLLGTAVLQPQYEHEELKAACAEYIKLSVLFDQMVKFFLRHTTPIIATFAATYAQPIINFLTRDLPFVGREKRQEYFPKRVNVSLNMIDDVTSNDSYDKELKMRTVEEMSMEQFFGKGVSQRLLDSAIKAHREHARRSGLKKAAVRESEWCYPFLWMRDIFGDAGEQSVEQMTQMFNDHVRNRLSSLFGSAYMCEDLGVPCTSRQYIFALTFEKMENGQNEKVRVLLIRKDRLRAMRGSDVHKHAAEAAQLKRDMQEGGEEENLSLLPQLRSKVYYEDRWMHLLDLRRIVFGEEEWDDDTTDEYAKHLTKRVHAWGLLVSELWISTRS